MRQGLSDYLNFNRHKFNEYGQFNAKPDERDFLPQVMLVADNLNPPKLPPKEPQLNKTQRFWAKHPEANLLRNPKTDEDLVRERHEERRAHAKKRRKYSKDKCDEHLKAAEDRCSKMYWNNDLYPDGAYRGCIERAKELWQECYNNGKYPKGKMEWRNIDMDIVDEAPTPDPRVITFDSVDMPVIVPPMWVPRSDQNAKAKALLLRPPLVEGSLPANDDFPRGNNSFLRPGSRGSMIRATPGMGYIGQVPGLGGLGGGKLPYTRPFDPRMPIKLN
jgi:hypothetical protein